jgi:hypothetical protein
VIHGDDGEGDTRFSDKKTVAADESRPMLLNNQWSLIIELRSRSSDQNDVVHAAIHVMLRRPVMKEITASTRNTRNRIWAMLAAEPAIPVKPRTAATIAMTKKVMA